MQFCFKSFETSTFIMIFSYVKVAGKSMSFETGKMGRQAGGSVVSRTQDTMVRTREKLPCLSNNFFRSIARFFLLNCSISLSICAVMLTEHAYMCTHAHTHTHTLWKAYSSNNIHTLYPPLFSFPFLSTPLLSFPFHYSLVRCTLQCAMREIPHLWISPRCE